MTLGNPEDYRGLPDTRWTLVHRAGAGDEQALNDLLSSYRPALLTHLVLGKRLKPDEAEDVLHDFVRDKILRSQIIARAQQAKGKFRTFLLTALDRYLISQFRKQQAAKRKHLEADIDPYDSRLKVAANEAVSPADAEWARLVLERALAQTREECESKQQNHFWILFDDRVGGPCFRGDKPTPYEELMRRLGFRSPLDASNALTTVKRRFARAVRSVVAEYSRDDEEIDAEIAALHEILIGAGA